MHKSHDLETTLCDQLDAVDRRLIEVAQAIEETGLVLTGSRGQPRSNTMIATESLLRAERTRVITALTSLHAQQEVDDRLAAELQAANRLTAWAPQAPAE